MLTGIHFLLTYACTFECDHCFLYSSPRAQGTFTLDQIRHTFDEIDRIGTIKMVFFEGGEPFLYYPLMVEGFRIARQRGVKASAVSNAYWATSVEDAGLWLKQLCEQGIAGISLSDDLFHHDSKEESPAKKAHTAATELGIDAGTICIEEPKVLKPGEGQEKGAPVIGGGAMFKGRAVEKLITGLPTRPWEELTSCPHEELQNPERVHIDAYGHVHICQGISMGNMWETPLSELVKQYDADQHPICGPLIKGGPALLAKEYKVEHDDRYVDECHMCYLVRRALIDRFPQHLAPKQVYGLEYNESSDDS